MLVTIKELLTRPFPNTPYFSQSDNISIVNECPKFGNFQILTKRSNFEIPELWTAIKYTKIIGISKVRGVLKRSRQGLFNGDKQKMHNGLIDCAKKA